ncbi:MAG TPA: lamin tail domain-containing protein, partial [Anaerolineae bacterium]|nr:lamin tail domain-containing protein [Anaerolineae bacterium]
MHIARASIVIILGLAAAPGVMSLLYPLAGVPAQAARHSASALDVVINEVAWGGTAANANHEWIELKNQTTSPLNLTGWSLRSGDGSPDIALSGTIPADGYWLLERSTDSAVSDIPADQVYAGSLLNTGEALTLTDALGDAVDTANADGGGWPAGSGSPDYLSMERTDAATADADSNWASNDGLTRNGLDANANPIQGTPRQPNSARPDVSPPVQPGSVLISAVHYDAYANGDEGFRLTNVSSRPITLTAWMATDGQGEGRLDLSGALDAGRSIWIARRAITFTQQFGFKPDYEYDADTDPSVPNLGGAPPALAPGDELAIRQGADNWIDAVVWGSTGQISDTGWYTGWLGPNVQRYSNNSSAAVGQMLYRRLDEATGRIGADTDTARDWANDSADPIFGRRPMYPGWDLELFWPTARVTASAWPTVAVAPDNAYRVISDLLGSARESIRLEIYSFENLGLLEVLTRTMQARGVSVTALLEGDPVGGVTDQQLWVCQHLQRSGGACWFMANDSAADVRDRYDYLHAKMIIVDERVVAIGSENASPRSLPYDDPSDGTLGQRGAYLLTDAPGVVARALEIWRADFDPLNHRDIVAWGSGTYLTPPLGFTPVYTTGGAGYPIRYPAPLSLSAPLTFELLTSPESSLRTSDSLLAWIAQAGPGDAIDVERLSEPPHWGDSTSSPVDDPNLGLQALIDAASRGAQVRLLLDSFFDEAGSPTGNEATRVYVDSLRALSPTLAANLHVRLGNPTLGGIHTKMFLFGLGGRKVVHVGSLNGSEVSSKVNREIALQVESAAAYDYLHGVFEFDWASQPRAYLPFLVRAWRPPADHVLVSEVFYRGATSPITGSEWIQIYNPTPVTVSLASYALGDEETRGSAGPESESMWRFPPSAAIGPGQKVNVATTFAGFYQRYGYDPHFAFYEGVPGVSRMSPHPTW